MLCCTNNNINRGQLTSQFNDTEGKYSYYRFVSEQPTRLKSDTKEKQHENQFIHTEKNRRT